LIAEHDGLAAERLARILREAGHTALLARDAPSALREVAAGPYLVFLDLGLPDPTGGRLLRRLRSHIETARIPLVLLGGRRDVEAHLAAPGTGQRVGILVNPVSAGEVLRAVQSALRDGADPPPDALLLTEHRRSEIIRRLIVEGPDRVAFHVYRRLAADRMLRTGVNPPESLTWPQIAEWAKLERLVTSEEADLVAQAPPPALEAGSPPAGLGRLASEEDGRSPQTASRSKQGDGPGESQAGV
jgi:CheY-like chemotaxis protein